MMLWGTFCWTNRWSPWQIACWQESVWLSPDYARCLPNQLVSLLLILRCLTNHPWCHHSLIIPSLNFLYVPFVQPTPSFSCPTQLVPLQECNRAATADAMCRRFDWRRVSSEPYLHTDLPFCSCLTPWSHTCYPLARVVWCVACTQLGELCHFWAPGECSWATRQLV